MLASWRSFGVCCSNTMKLVVALAILGLMVCHCSTTPVQQEYGIGARKFKISDKQFLQREKDILRLFRYINQPSYYKDHQDIANTYSFESSLDSYKNASAVKEFLGFFRAGLLPRGEIFSIFYDYHLRQAISLFNVLYSARDFDTFYKAAAWARNNVNEGMFLYAFSVALVHRPDTFGFILPPIYEINPYYFFNSEVIKKAQEYKQYYQGQSQKTYTIYSNYSGYYLNLNAEQSMSYYLEDPGINSFYYYCGIYYPFWLGGDEFDLKNDRRGEQYYYLYQQLLARYYLERLSNDFGEIEFFNYEEPFKYGYYPSLRYANGMEFPTRPNFARLSEYFSNYGQSWTFRSRYGYSYTHVQDLERRFRDAIDAGYAFGGDAKLIDLNKPDGFEILGNLIESNADSPNRRYYDSYETYGRHLLGYSYQPLTKYQVAPSALEHYETALRDPAFYQLYKRVVLLFQKFKTYLPPYTYNELHFPGVNVEKIDFDRLVTYFDNFDADVSNAVYVTADEFENEPFKVRVRQQRLNHKPFTYRIQVNADVAVEAVVRLYLGPKYDEYGRPFSSVQQNRMNFVEIDMFKYKLQAGKNLIERNSRQPFWYVPDRTTYKELFVRVMGALDKSDEFQLDASEAFYGYPNRFLLPMGKPAGQTFQMYVMVSPYVAPIGRRDHHTNQDYYFQKVGTGYNYIDNYAFGYPFDRVINEAYFNVPNSMFHDVVIYHKTLEDVNSSQAANDP